METSVEGVVLVTWFDEHWYRIDKDGQTHYLPSVTTKLQIVDKPYLKRWYGDIGTREAERRMNEAGERGTRIHWAWAVALQSGVVVYDPWKAPIYTSEGIAELKKKHGDVAVIRNQEEMWTLVKLQRQFDLLKPTILGVEERLFDLESRDAGTADAIYWIAAGDYFVNGAKAVHLEEGIYINDLKTGAQVQDEAYNQTAKYLDMYEKTHGLKCAGTLITHTQGKTTRGVPGLSTLVRTREQVFDEDLPLYNKIAAVWNDKHKDDQPQTYEFPSLITLKLKEKEDAIV